MEVRMWRLRGGGWEVEARVSDIFSRVLGDNGPLATGRLPWREGGMGGGRRPESAQFTAGPGGPKRMRTSRAKKPKQPPPVFLILFTRNKGGFNLFDTSFAVSLMQFIIDENLPYFYH